MTPQVVPGLLGQNVSQIRGGQHHALALTQVYVPPSKVCLSLSGFGVYIVQFLLASMQLHLLNHMSVVLEMG